VSVALLNRTIGTLTTIALGVAFGGGSLLLDQRTIRQAKASLALDTEAAPADKPLEK